MNRLQTTQGAICPTGDRVIVHNDDPHHGEEDAPCGWNGLGTIFSSGCILHSGCCQNGNISQKRASMGSASEFRASTVSKEMYLNLMDQYHPCFRAGDRPHFPEPSWQRDTGKC